MQTGRSEREKHAAQIRLISELWTSEFSHRCSTIILWTNQRKTPTRNCLISPSGHMPATATFHSAKLMTPLPRLPWRAGNTWHTRFMAHDGHISLFLMFNYVQIQCRESVQRNSILDYSLRNMWQHTTIFVKYLMEWYVLTKDIKPFESSQHFHDWRQNLVERTTAFWEIRGVQWSRGLLAHHCRHLCKLRDTSSKFLAP